MPKPIKFLITTVEDEVEIFSETDLQAMNMSEGDVAEAYGHNAYWMELSLKDGSFSDQQEVTRKSIDAKGQFDETLVPQKRFVQAVVPNTWTKRYADEPNSTVLSVDETTFCDLKPPALGNRIDNAILSVWYPGASKSKDFIKAWQRKREESVKGTESTFSPSTQESSPTTAGG